MSSRIARRSAASSGEMPACFATIWCPLFEVSCQELRLPENRPRFEKRLDPVFAIFTADAGVFETSPGRLRIIGHIVDHHAPGPNLRSHAPSTLYTGPKGGRVETILGFVGDSDRLVLRVIADNREHGAENFLTRDCHVVLHVDKHRGLHEVSLFESPRLPRPANEHLRAFLDAFADMGLHLFVLFL